ncbi:uncharacterized protein LOC144180150 [Haemaphysalis longicornis]
MALRGSPHRSPRGPEPGEKFGVPVSRRLPAPPPSDATVAPGAAHLGWQPACASRASVPQERGRSLLQLSAFRLEAPPAVGGLHAHGARRRASSLGTETARPPRSSLGSDPQRITDTTSPPNCVLDPAVWSPTVTAVVLHHDRRLHVNKDLRRRGGARAGRLERFLGTMAALGCDHLFLCPNKDSAGAPERPVGSAGGRRAALGNLREGQPGAQPAAVLSGP